MDQFLAAFARDLAELEFGPLEPGLGDRVAYWVTQRVDGSADVARLGLGAVCVTVAAWVRLRTGRPYVALDPEVRRTWARRIARSRLPGVSELVRAVRSLAVAYVYDARYATAP